MPPAIRLLTSELDKLAESFATKGREHGPLQCSRLRTRTDWSTAIINAKRGEFSKSPFGWDVVRLITTQDPAIPGDEGLAAYRFDARASKDQITRNAAFDAYESLSRTTIQYVCELPESVRQELFGKILYLPVFMAPEWSSCLFDLARDQRHPQLVARLYVDGEFVHSNEPELAWLDSSVAADIRMQRSHARQAAKQGQFDVEHSTMPDVFAASVLAIEVMRHELEEARAPADEMDIHPTQRRGRPKGIPLDEAEVRVRVHLAKYARDNPAAIKRDAVAAATGVSAGQVSNTKAWKTFTDRRDAEAKPVPREVPLNERMQSRLRSNCERPDELASLIEEQDSESAEDERHGKLHGGLRHNRRHERS